jgi:hypothetical protein
MGRSRRCHDPLTNCDPRQENVKTIAFGNGFYSLERFVVEYERMFAESRSQTL